MRLHAYTYQLTEIVFFWHSLHWQGYMAIQREIFNCLIIHLNVDAIFLIILERCNHRKHSVRTVINSVAAR